MAVPYSSNAAYIRADYPKQNNATPPFEDPRSTILLVSYPAPFTLGRAFQNGETDVTITRREYHRKAEVCTISGLSAHAGQTFLLDYAEAGPLKRC